MNRIPSETLPRFETTLPREFFAPPAKKSDKPLDWRTVAFTAILTTGFVATLAITHQEPVTRPSLPIPVATPAPVSRPVATPAPVQVPIPVAPAVIPEPLVMRALPVEPTVRPALPVEGQLYGAPMPDGRILLIRYMGSVQDFSGLPKNPNLYDYYKVIDSGHAWVFMQPAGFSAPSWVDP